MTADLLHSNPVLSLPQQLARLLPAELPGALEKVVHIHIIRRGGRYCRYGYRVSERAMTCCCVRDGAVYSCLTLGGVTWQTVLGLVSRWWRCDGGHTHSRLVKKVHALKDLFVLDRVFALLVLLRHDGGWCVPGCPAGG